MTMNRRHFTLLFVECFFVKKEKGAKAYNHMLKRRCLLYFMFFGLFLTEELLLKFCGWEQLYRRLYMLSFANI